MLPGTLSGYVLYVVQQQYIALLPEKFGVAHPGRIIGAKTCCRGKDNAVACLPSGLLTDAIGARKTITFCLGIAAAGTMLFAVSSSVPLLGAARAMIGFGVSSVYIAAMKIFSDWYKKNELATCSGALLAVGNVGALLSTAPLVVLIGNFGWRSTFVGLGWYTIAVAIISYLLIRNSPTELGFSPVEPAVPQAAQSTEQQRQREGQLREPAWCSVRC